MQALLRQWIVSFMGITLNFSTGEIGWSSGTTTAAPAVDNLLMETGDQAFAIALEAYTTNDSNGVIDALIIEPRLI